ncbi:hypothetical protein [Salsuginibacillus kocurii]|uniref:hypothetical protein n=1 Tax=Salsuginibacillus kocurii TaxID=427078 RepID=UPI000362B45D|nr:hypothetical protein [Salsuginibacillus kocurii]
MEHLREVFEKSLDLSATIIEGAEHTQTLLTNENYDESVRLMNDVMTGYSSVQSALEQIDPEQIDLFPVLEQGKQVEASIEHIVTAFEEETYGKANEILQFTLIPRLKKWQHEMNTLFGPLVTEH